jgi:putative RecB family exonuclease
MPRKFTVSPTKLRIFAECPAQYRLEYFDKLGRFYHKARAGFSFGTTLHKTLEAYHAAGGPENVSLETLQTSLTTNWISPGYATPEQEVAFQEEGQKILEAYHTAQVEAKSRAEAGEAPPEARLLYSEKTLKMDLTPEIVLSGRVDRVDEHFDQSLEIVDYKSGRLTVTEEDVANAPAMGIYQLLLKNTHPERRVRATIVALRTGDFATHEQTPEEAEFLQADCTETAQIIHDKDWESVLPTPCDHCPHCDFLPYCEKFWKRRRYTQQ